ncbi:thioredoxin [Phosphitispora fastidiosa]|uniref:thioredoxin n=1 Tax=Phosphitispora fastidiosa TaxID=2837202 RepID=UPI001E345752|nr:thioredoxin [Phosphitispora fastidiosa]MBU7007893.1 thioredoxin 1 [Phosphitispora fastidiosa]
MASDKVLVLTNNNFKGEVLEASEPVLVDYWAPWCSPCRMIGPIVDELAGEYQGKIKVGKVNVDENREIAIEYGVMSIPTLIVFKAGKAVDRVVGFKSKNDLKAVLEKHV